MIGSCSGLSCVLRYGLCASAGFERDVTQDAPLLDLLRPLEPPKVSLALRSRLSVRQLLCWYARSCRSGLHSCLLCCSVLK